MSAFHSGLLRPSKGDRQGLTARPENNLFYRASMRVAGRVYVAAHNAGNTNAAMHAWNRLVRLISQRSKEEIAVMEQRMGVRR